MHSILLLCFLIGFCVVSTLPEKKNQAFNIWTASSCQQVTTLLRTKSGVLQKLKKNVVEIQKSLKLSEEEKKTRLSVLNIFSDELDASESSIFSSLMALRAALKGNFRSLDELKRSSTRRLDALKAAAVQEEERFNAILEAEKHGFELKNAKLKNQHLNHSSVAEKFLDEMLAEVAEAADKLELSLQENVFESVAKSKDVELETVVKIPEHLVQRGNETYHDHHEGEDDEVIRLVDSQSNQYILTKAKDSTVPHEDHYFIHDLIYLLLTCCVLGLLCSKLGIPTMFGYVLSGVLFGPSGLGAITAVVQVETIGEFGVYFMLFVVGLEFSPGKLRKVLIIAVTGSIAIVILMICGGLIVGYLVGIHQLQSSFVAACLSLSSTPLVVKFMQQSSTHLILPTKGHNSDTSEVGSTLVGLLVMQDTQLALIIAILPSLATNVVGTDSDIHTSSPSTENTISTAVMFTLLSLVGLVLSSFILSKLLMIAITRQAFRLENREICLLFALLSCLLALVITDRANMCMELGCFLAGLVVSSQSKEFCEKIFNVMEPVKDMFSAVFFASIGFHIFPTFLQEEWLMLFVLTYCVITFKWVVSFGVLSFLMGRQNRAAWVVAAGLAQVSEFSFVLSSRARRLKMLSREAYLLILSITTLSLAMAPILWQLCIKQIGRQAASKSIR